MQDRNPSFTTHLRPSRCVALAADPQASLDADEIRHALECSRCREFLSHMIKQVAPDAAAAEQILARAFRVPSDAETTPTADMLLAKVERLREHADFPGAFGLLTSIVLMDGKPETRQRCALASARLHREMGYIDIAVKQFRALLQSPGLAVWATLSCLNNLAWFERQKGRLDAADSLLRQAFDLGRANPVPAVQKEFAETLHQQAVLMMTREKYADAETLIEQALRIRSEIDGPEQLDVARSLLIKGAIWSLRGDTAEGLMLLGKAREIRVSALGPNHADVADLLYRMGDMYKKQGRHTEAKRAYDDAIESFKNSASTLLGLLGLACCHARLAEIYKHWEQYDLASNFEARATTVLERFRLDDQEYNQGSYESALRRAMPVPN